ncbi:MAG: transglycosylase SLT domain-containing protein [Synergistaceae bacterium]|jgi:hypothetical protein|nr:transglycosylase SLT domain-containing protein [Synergistaceae bacterium]
MSTSEKVSRWWNLVDKWAVQVGVSQSLILAVIQQESGGNPNASRYEPAYEKNYILGNPERLALCKKLGISTHDAAASWGLMQLMFFTAYGYGGKTIKTLLDPDQNIRFGAAHLGALIKTYRSKEAALAAYNGGGKGAADWKAGKGTDATRYAKNVMALYEKYRDAALVKGPSETKDLKPVNPGWNYFKVSEFVCKCGCGTNKVKSGLIDTLNIIRGTVGEAITVTSGTRCPTHNKKAGGVANSNHLSGDAADIQAKGVAPAELRGIIRNLWEQGKLPELAGLGAYKTFTHVDIAPKVKGRLRTWNG